MPFRKYSSPDRNRRLRPAAVIFYLFVLVSLTSLVASRVSPATFWPAGFLASASPVLYLLNVVLFFFLLLRGSVHAGVALVVILAGWFLVGKTYQWGTSVPPLSVPSFRVLSYNVSFFSVPRVFSDAYRDPVANLTVDNATTWLRATGAEVLCLQEVFDDEDSDIYNTVETLTDSGAYNHHFVYQDQVKNRTRRGLLILSRFPMVARGEVFISDNHFNGAIYADVLVEGDTVRIINAHLESMHLGARQSNPLRVLSAYRRGMVIHSRQVDQLVDFIRQSPYPTILSGDLNETPYGYVYRQLDAVMNNAFEAAGQGFGFTYRGRKLFFLRIDHQFFTDELEVIRYVTHDDLPYSQHVPIEAAYTLTL